MKVSVIMPFLNSEDYIKSAIESILSQSYQDFVLILVNDHSIDNSKAIISPFLKYCKNIKYLENKGKPGIANSTNLGIKQSNSKYIVLADSDDLSEADRIGKQVSFMDKHSQVGASGTWMQEFYNGKNCWKFPTKNSELKALCLLHSPICNPSAIIRRAIVEELNIHYDSTYPIAQDYNYWIQLFDYTQFANIPEILVHYRVHTKSISNSNPQEDYFYWKKTAQILLQKLNIIAKEEEFQMLYNMRFPDFYTQYYLKRKVFIDRFISKILLINAQLNIFPQTELTSLFDSKISCLNKN